MSLKTAIVLTFDKTYYEFAPVLVKSLAMNYHKPEKLNVVCIVSKDILDKQDEFISLVNESEKLNIEFRVSDRFEDIRMSKKLMMDDRQPLWLNDYCYLRLFVSSVCHDYDKAIYMDVDILAMRDIQPLLDFPMHRPFTALYEGMASQRRWCGNIDLSYFNDGVFITDLNWWRENNMEDQLADWITNNPPTNHSEQDVLNKFFGDSFYPLPNTFNFFRWHTDPMTVPEPQRPDFPEPLLLHFLAISKPWNSLYLLENNQGERRFFDCWFEVYRTVYGRDVVPRDR